MQSKYIVEIKIIKHKNDKCLGKNVYVNDNDSTIETN